MSVAAVTVKEVHQRAKEKEDIREGSEHMRPVLREKVKSPDGEEAKQYNRTKPPPPWRISIRIHVFRPF